MMKVSKMKLIKMKIKDVIIPKDYPRKETKYGDRFLSLSIVQQGQIDPVVVDAKNNLIAGKRRLQEMKKNHVFHQISI